MQPNNLTRLFTLFSKLWPSRKFSRALCKSPCEKANRSQKTSLYFAILFVLCTAASPYSLGQEIIRVGTNAPIKSTGVSKVIKPWVETLEAETALKFKTYWGGTLGKSPYKQFELVRSGVLDVAWVLPIYSSGQFPEMGLFELPFLFRTAEEASTVGWELYQRGLLTGFDNTQLIAIFTTEPSALFMKKKIKTLDDLKNMKIRSAGLIQSKWLESFGASSQTLGTADMNQALSKGAIDGVIQGWSGMRTFKTFQLVDQSYAVPAGTITFLLLMNKKKWDRIPENTQRIIMEHSGMNIVRAGSAAYAEVNQRIRNDLKSEGRVDMLTPEPSKFQTFAKHSQKIHQWWIEKTPNGQIVYDEALEMLSELRQTQSNPTRSP